MSNPATTPIISIPSANPLDTDGDSGEFRLIQNGDFFTLVGVDDQTITGFTSSSTDAYLSRPNGNPSRLDPWKAFTVDKDTLQTGVNFRTTKRLGVVAIKDVTYVFWIDTSSYGLLYATRIFRGEQHRATDWCLVRVPNVSSTAWSPVSIPSRGVCASASKLETEILLTFIQLNGNGQVSQIVLDVRNFNSLSNEWDAVVQPWTVWVDNSMNNQTLYDIRAIVVAQPDPDAQPGQDSKPVNSVIAAIWNEVQYTTTTVTWTLDELCHSHTVRAGAASSTTIQWPGNVHVSRGAEGMCLAMDPAGRLISLFADVQNSRAITIAVLQDISVLVKDDGSIPTWVEYGTVLTPSEDTQGPISASFSIGTMLGAPTSDTATYSIILGLAWIRRDGYSSGSPVQMSSLNYGDFKVQTMTHPPKPDYAGMRTLTSICDPFPMPIPPPAIWGNGSPDGMSDWNLFEYEMNTSNEEVVLNEVNLAVRVGFEYTSKKVATENVFGAKFGLGGSFGFSAKMGGTYHYLGQESKFTAQSIKVQTKAYKHPYYAVDDPSPYLIRPYGCYFGRSLFSLRSIYGTAQNVAYSNGTYTPPPLIEAHAPVVDPSADETVAGDYFAYACIPGDMESYTQTAINARMTLLYTECVSRLAAAGTTATEIAHIFTDENGQDLSHFYLNNNYVADVVAAYGTETNLDGQRYLKFALSGSSVCDGQYRVSNSESNGFGVTLDVNMYAGLVTTGEGGVGTGFSSEDYIGVTFDLAFSYRRESTEGSSKGVGLYTYLNTLAPTQTLSSRLYILKEAYLWALELQYFPTIARDWYLKGLSDAATAGEFANPLAPDFSMLAGTISAENVLLYGNSLPARFLFVVTGWDQGPAVNAPINVPTNFPGGVDIATFNAGVADGACFVLPGPCDVAYGGDGKYRVLYGVTGSIRFNTATFGDPNPGGSHAGYYRQVGFPDRTTYQIPADFDKAGDAYQTITLQNPPRTVAYGYGSNWNVVAGLSGTITVGDDTFGDPMPGQSKQVWIKKP